MAASVTKTVESGAFIRTTIRHDNRRKQETKRMKPNDKKVILGHLGDFEVYVYPYDFPDTVFIGAYPVSTQISSSNVGELGAAFQKARWFLAGYWQNEPNWRIAPNSRKRACEKAYNAGLETVKKAK